MRCPAARCVALAGVLLLFGASVSAATFLVDSTADSIDTAKVRSAMETLDGFDIGIYGPVKWTGKETYGINRQLLMQYFFSEVKGGKIVKVKKFTP